MCSLGSTARNAYFGCWSFVLSPPFRFVSPPGSFDRVTRMSLLLQQSRLFFLLIPLRPPPPPTRPPPLSVPGGLIRDAVSKVRRALPGNRDDECEPPPCIDPNDPVAVAAAAAAAAAGGAGAQSTFSSSGGAGGSEQGSSFVEVVREAAAALDVSGAKEVGSRIAEKVKECTGDSRILGHRVGIGVGGHRERVGYR